MADTRHDSSIPPPRQLDGLRGKGRLVSDLWTPLIREVTDTARARGNADPRTVAGIMALLGIAGAIHGPTINRAIGRDPDDHTLYDSTAHMFKEWIEHQNRQTS